MSGWGKLDEQEGGGGGLFIKLKDGESVEGVFRGEPHCFYQIFKDKREYENYVEGSSFRFKLVMIIKENGAYVGKILQQGVKLGKSVRLCTQECGMDYIYKIIREGSSKDDTIYQLIPKRALTESEKSQIEAVEIPSLKSTRKKSSGEESPSDDSDFPFGEGEPSGNF